MLMQEFTSALPDVYQALGVIGKSASEAGLEKSLVELVKLRAAQINGCAFCLSFHTGMAKKFGVPQAKLDLLAAWRGASIYDERERAALAWTEALTLMAQRHTGAEEEAEVRKHFDDRQFLGLTVAIGLINSWNRICGGLGILPPEALDGAKGA